MDRTLDSNMAPLTQAHWAETMDKAQTLLTLCRNSHLIRRRRERHLNS
uniref:Uncharacterized protein n=1 Tax=Rhizophora mucronata TaxID=61149 RepID=A0A2P2P0V7_RHIMU